MSLMPAGMQTMDLGRLANMFSSGMGAPKQPKFNYENFQFGPQFDYNQQTQAANKNYEADLSKLRKEAIRGAQGLIGKGKNRKYLNNTAAAPVSASDKATLRSLVDVGNIGINLGSMSPTSQYYNDMLPFVDRYNALQAQYGR
jgi:hypothetical protein